MANQAVVFRNVAAHDYQLSETSPAVDRGIPVSNVTVDIDGNPRPQGSGWDIGAYEYTPSTIIYVSKDSSCNGLIPCRSSVQNGIALASGPSVVEITQDTYNEYLVLNFSGEIMLGGGWNTDFTSNSSYTTLSGLITITHGTLTLQNIILK